MRLELRWSVVDDLAAGPATRLAGRRLEVDVDGLRALLAADLRLTGVRLDLVHPGERCRIGRVFDVVAPRAKLDGGEDFPGVVGGVARAGQGTTLALEGVAVVATDQQTDNVGTLAVIDMAGPNAELSAFGRTRNLVISAWPASGTERSDYLAAVRLAALKTAVCLARAAGRAAHTLGADGAVLTKIGGGAPHVDMAQAASQCEALGVRTTAVVEDMSTDGSAEGMLLFDLPGVDSLVNVGSSQEPLTLPAVDRVVGADDLAAKLLGETRATYGGLCGAIEQVGTTRVMAEVR